MTKDPVSFETAVRTVFLSVWVAVTSTPGSKAPDTSAIVPLIWAVA